MWIIGFDLLTDSFAHFASTSIPMFPSTLTVSYSNGSWYFNICEPVAFSVFSKNSGSDNFGNIVVGFCWKGIVCLEFPKVPCSIFCDSFRNSSWTTIVSSPHQIPVVKVLIEPRHKFDRCIGALLRISSARLSTSLPAVPFLDQLWGINCHKPAAAAEEYAEVENPG